MTDQNELIKRIVELRKQLNIANTVPSEISREIDNLEKQLYGKIEATDTGEAISRMAKIAAINSDDVAKEVLADAPGNGKEMIMAIMRALVKRERYVPVSLVIEVAEKCGMYKESARAIIDDFRRDGDVFKPRPGLLKLP